MFSMLNVLTERQSQTGYSGWAVCQAWWCRAECTTPSDSRHERTVGWDKERLQSVTVAYKPSHVLVIRTEVTRTICQVIFHMMMWLQDSKNKVGSEWILLIYTHIHVHQLVNETGHLSSWNYFTVYDSPLLKTKHTRKEGSWKLVPLPSGKTPIRRYICPGVRWVWRHWIEEGQELNLPATAQMQLEIHNTDITVKVP